MEFFLNKHTCKKIHGLKGKNRYSIMTSKQNKKSNTENKTTLDTLHNNQLMKMGDNENELIILQQEQQELEEKINAVENDMEYDKIENRLKIIINEI